MSAEPDPDFDAALIAVRSILGLLHYRGLVDSEQNRADVAAALDKITPFSREAEQRAMSRHRQRERDG